MKKFLSAISLLLAVIMIMAVMPMSVFAEDAPAGEPVEPQTPSYGAAADFAIANGLPVYYVPGASVANGLDHVDGIVSPDDPWYTSGVTVEDPTVYADTNGFVSLESNNVLELNPNDKIGYKKDGNNFVLDGNGDKIITYQYDLWDNSVYQTQANANKFTYYVAQDDNYYYVSYKVVSDTPIIDGVEYATPRHNTNFGIGFDLGDSTEYINVFHWTRNNDTPAFNYVSDGWTKKSGADASAAVEKWAMNRFALEPGYMAMGAGSNSGSVNAGAVVNQNNTAVAYVYYYEMAVKKSEIVAKYGVAPKGVFVAQPSQVYVAPRDGSYKWTWPSCAPIYGGTALTSELKAGLKAVLPEAKADAADALGYFPTLFVLDDDMLRTYENSNYKLKDAGQEFMDGSMAKATSNLSVDGLLGEDEGYVKLTNGLKASAMTSTILTATSSGVASTNAAHYANIAADKLSTLDYYVAQDEDNIYFLIKDIGGEWGTDGMSHMFRNNYRFHVGFDPNNLANKFVVEWVYNVGAVNKVLIGNGGTDTDVTSTKVVASSAMTKWTYDAANDKAVEKTYSLNGNHVQAQGQYVAFIEIAFDKAKIKEAYKSNLNVELGDLNTMYFASSGQAYNWTVPSGTGGTAVVGFSLHGNLVADHVKTLAPEYANLKILPDVIYLGGELEANCQMAEGGKCSFILENAIDRYFVQEKTCTTGDIYYKNCRYCNAPGFSMFEVDNALGHTANIAAPTETEDQICTVCNVVLEEATGHIHNYEGVAWSSDSSGHWKECAAEDCSVKISGKHVIGSNGCTTCGYGKVAGGGGGGAPVVPPVTEAPTTEAPTEAPTTEAPTTAPVTEAPTEAPTTEAPTTAPVTDAPTEPETTAPVESESESVADTKADTDAETKPADGGCGASVGLVGLAIVAALGTCAVVTAKKREE